MDKVPPIQTLAEELTLWTLNHTAKLPKCQRFTFGQRLDNETLDVVELIAQARFSSGKQRIAVLRKLNLSLEKLRVFPELRWLRWIKILVLPMLN